MNMSARRKLFIIMAFLLMAMSARAETDDVLSPTQFGETVGQYIHEHSKNGIDANTVKKYIDSVAKKNNDYMRGALQWPGDENALLVADLNQNGAMEVIVSRFESETRGSLYIYSSPDYRRPIEHISYQYPESYAVRGSGIQVVDLNGDGKKDIIVRQFTGAQRVQSIDCVFILCGTAFNLKYKRCFSQSSALEAALEADRLNIPYVRKASSPFIFDGSYFMDLDNNGTLEMVATSEYCPKENELDCDRASYIIWPDIYQWNGSAYELANHLFPEFYRKYQAGMAPLKRVKEILDAK